MLKDYNMAYHKTSSTTYYVLGKVSDDWMFPYSYVDTYNEALEKQTYHRENSNEEYQIFEVTRNIVTRECIS